ncbi:patatin-like phospholipase family protein [Amphritea balenae]|uniref:Serine protease n=1 Tax=Amphritea balenae TaxID=452629 RepID=A0A3P1SVN9_9GAMM|nr:patatin-like phospholipase family protein [Amphritea balenae]RRD01267.1 serine protease [Amphritea balenae]GGK58595.1 serine protease [Amphritea balenae]
MTIEPQHKTTVSLVLGSGGARGLAHIGIIQWLEEQGYQIRSISGCSIGALVGGIYAAGKLDEYEAWVRAIGRLDIVHLLDLSWSNSGLIKGDKIINTLTELVGDTDIEQLPISFTAVAANIDDNKEVWLDKGSLFDAIRASISLPLLFTPVLLNGDRLIDGGVLNPVPIAPTFSDQNDLTIAVNLSGEPVKVGSCPIPVSQDRPESMPLHQRISSYISDLTGSVSKRSSFDWEAYDIAHQAFDAMQTTIARQKLAAYPPDLSIDIPRNVCSTLEFHRAAELIELGYQAAAKNIPART